MSNVSVADLERAVVQLNGSEKGKQAMRDLLTFLENGGVGLNTADRLSCLCLLSGAWHDHADTALEALRVMVKPQGGSASVEPAAM